MNSELPHPNELISLVQSYLPEEFPEWKKVFPDEFFEQLERLYGKEKSALKNKSEYYAKLIMRYIYEPVKKFPEDTYAYRAQLWQTLGVMKVSSNKRTFESNYARLMGQSDEL